MIKMTWPVWLGSISVIILIIHIKLIINNIFMLLIMLMIKMTWPVLLESRKQFACEV